MFPFLHFFLDRLAALHLTQSYLLLWPSSRQVFSTYFSWSSSWEGQTTLKSTITGQQKLTEDLWLRLKNESLLWLIAVKTNWIEVHHVLLSSCWPEHRIGLGQGFDVVTGAGLEAACDLDSRQEFRSVTEDDEQK